MAASTATDPSSAPRCADFFLDHWMRSSVTPHIAVGIPGHEIIGVKAWLAVILMKTRLLLPAPQTVPQVPATPGPQSQVNITPEGAPEGHVPTAVKVRSVGP
jgi:hypothetical protein